METNIKKVLVPIDFSDYSKSALKYAVNFAKSFNAEIILVYVVEPVIYPPDFSMGQIAMPSINAEWDDRAKDELQKLAKSDITGSENVKTIIKTGKPFVEIIETAKEENVDLIIIATHGHSGVEHILFGSTAEKVVRKAPCPVLTLREPIKGFDYKEGIKKS
jgi:nucleotide-binding universal stress UspA family protein